MLKNFSKIRKNQILALITGIFNSLTMLFSSVFIQRIIDGVSQNNFALVRTSIIIMAGLVASNIIFNYIFQYNYRLLENVGSFELREKYFKDILDSDYLDSKTFDSGSVLVSLTNDTVKISNYYATGIITFIMELVVFIVTMVILFYYNIILALAILAFVVVGVLLSNRIAVRIGEETVKLQGASSKEQEEILQAISGIRTIKQLKKERYFASLYQEKLGDNVKYSKSLSKYISQYATVFTIISNILPLISVLISMYFVLNADMSLGEMVAIMTVAGALTEPVTQLGQIINQKNVAKSLIEKNKIYENDKSTDNIESNKDLKVKMLNFDSPYYLFGDKRLLEDVKFSLERSKAYLLKGPSGSGKSTIFDLLMKFLPKKDVEILIDGEDLDNISNRDLYGNILEVDQNIITVNETIEDNICLGDSFSKEAFDEVIKVCQLEKLIREKGKEFVIDSKATNLSGGEKQRISIARILIRKPKLLLLDEPTSALDQETSVNFARDLLAYCRSNDIGLFIISHDEKVFDDMVDGTIYIA